MRKGLSLRAAGWGFPLLLWAWTPATLIEGKRKREPKQLPSCTIPLLLITYHVAWNFCRFWFLRFFQWSTINKFLQIKTTTNIFPTNIYSKVNILQRKFATQNHSTKKSCPFNYNLSLSFRNKAVYNEILVLHWFYIEQGMHTVVLFKNMYMYCMYSINSKILWILGTGYFLKIANINS